MARVIESEIVWLGSFFFLEYAKPLCFARPVSHSSANEISGPNSIDNKDS